MINQYFWTISIENELNRYTYVYNFNRSFVLSPSFQIIREQYKNI